MEGLFETCAKFTPRGDVMIAAAQHGHQKFVEVLIEAGADVNKGNKYGKF